MEQILETIGWTGIFSILALAALFGIGWLLLASQAKKFNQTS